VIATGFGLRSFRADTLSDYEDAISQALREPGPTLIDVRIDPTGYREQARSQRG
jgi:thiamine pyrophosphate-dependent acetolactate synthase large subunit-like protein